MFYNMRSYLFLFGFAFILFGFLPFFSSATPPNIEEDVPISKRLQQTENAYNVFLGRLNSCKHSCMNRCMICGRGGSCYRDTQKCKSASQCEATECVTQKKNYDVTKKMRDEMRKTFAEYNSMNDVPADDNNNQNQANTPDNSGQQAQGGQDTENVVTQVRRGRKKMQKQQLAATGVTAGLSVWMISCCSANPVCSKCPALKIAVPAGIALTYALKDQKDKFKKTEEAMCETNSITADGCYDPNLNDNSNGGGTGNGDPGGIIVNLPNDPNNPLPDPLPPVCQLPGTKCNELNAILNPPNRPPSTCPPGDTACLAGNSPAPTPGALQGRSREEFARQFLDVYEPEGGWPPNLNPDKLAKQAGRFSYSDLTPKQQKQVKNLFDKYNKMNKGYLDNLAGDDMGTDDSFGSGSSYANLADSGSSASGMGTAKDGSNPVRSVGSNAFTGGGDPSENSFDDSDGGPAVLPKKKSNLADQMQKMLNNLYKNEPGQDPFAERSVNFGRDYVGVTEDNIFMMVHRRHRSLDDRGTFIGEGF